MDRETLITWYELMSEIDSRYLFKAIKKVITKSKYMPTLSDLLEEIKNLTIEECVFTEKEKIEHMKKNGITPKWLEEFK